MSETTPCIRWLGVIDGRQNWRTPWKPLHQFVLLPPVEQHLAWTTTCCKAGPGPPVFVAVEVRPLRPENQRTCRLRANRHLELRAGLITCSPRCSAQNDSFRTIFSPVIAGGTTMENSGEKPSLVMRTGASTASLFTSSGFCVTCAQWTARPTQSGYVFKF